MALEQRAIGRRIAELREARRLTQPVMADRVGVSLRGYQKWEAGVAAPNWRNLEQLAEVLGVTADDLIGAGSGQRTEPVTETLARIEASVQALTVEMSGLEVRLTKKLDALGRRLREEGAPPARTNRRGS